MKRTKKALALILAVCMLIGMPLSVNVGAASAPTVKAVAMPDDMADSLNLTRGGAILLYFSEDVAINAAKQRVTFGFVHNTTGTALAAYWDSATKNQNSIRNDNCAIVDAGSYYYVVLPSGWTVDRMYDEYVKCTAESNRASYGLVARIVEHADRTNNAEGGDGKLNGITFNGTALPGSAKTNKTCQSNGNVHGSNATLNSRDYLDIPIIRSAEALTLSSAEWTANDKVAITFSRAIAKADDAFYAGMRIVNAKNEAMYFNPAAAEKYSTTAAEGAESLSAAVALTAGSNKTVATMTEKSTVTTAAFNSGSVKTYEWFRSHLDSLKAANPNEDYRIVFVVESKEESGRFVTSITDQANGCPLIGTENGKAVVNASSYNDPVQLEKVTMIGYDKLQMKFSAPVMLHNNGSYGVAILKDGAVVANLYQGSFNGQNTDGKGVTPTVSDTWTITAYTGGYNNAYGFTGTQIIDFANSEWVAKHLPQGAEIGFFIREANASTHDGLIDSVYTESGRKLENVSLGKCTDAKETLFVSLDDLFFTPKAYVADGGTLLISTPGLGGIGAWSGARLFLRAYDENGAVLVKDGQPVQWKLSVGTRFDGKNGQYCSSVLNLTANFGVSKYNDIVALLDKTYPDGYDLQMVLDDSGAKNGVVESMTRYDISKAKVTGWIYASEQYSTATADVAVVPFLDIVTIQNVSVSETGQVLVTFSHDIDVDKFIKSLTEHKDFFLTISPVGANSFVTKPDGNPLAQCSIGEFKKHSNNQIIGKVNAANFKAMMDTYNAKADTDNWEIRMRIEMETAWVAGTGSIPVNTNITAVDTSVMSPFMSHTWGSATITGRIWTVVDGCEPQLTMKVEQKSDHVLVATFGRNVKGAFVPEAVTLNDTLCKPYVGLRLVNETNSLIYSKIDAAGATIASLADGKAMQWSAQSYELTEDGTQMVITFADNVNISDIMEKSNLPAGLVNFPIKLCIEESKSKNGVTDPNCVIGNGKVWSVVSAANPESQLIANKTFGAGTWDGHYAEFTPLDPNAPIEVKGGVATITGQTTLSFEWTEAVEMGDSYRGIRFVDENGLLLYYDAEAGTVSRAAKGTALQWSVLAEYADSSKSKVKVTFGGAGRMGVLDLDDLINPAKGSEWAKVKALYPNGTFKLCFEERSPNNVPGVMEAFKGVDGKPVLAQPLIGNLNDGIWIDITGEPVKGSLSVVSVKAVSDAIIEVTFSKPVKFLSNPYTALRAYKGNDLLYFNTLTQEFTTNTKQTNADGEAMYKDADGNPTTQAVAADGKANTRIDNTPVQWAAVRSSINKKQTVVRYSFEGRDGVPMNGMNAILSYDWAALGARVVFCFEDNGADMVRFDQHVNNIVRADKENVALEGNLFIHDRDKYLSSIEMCFTPNPITAKATVINDLQIRVTFSQPVEIGSSYWGVRMMDKDGNLMYNEARNVAYQWSGTWEYENASKTSVIWTFNPAYSILGAANLYDLLNYRGVLEQFKDESTLIFGIEEKDTADVKTGRRNYIVETVSSLDGTNHLVGQTTTGYDSFTQKLGNGGLSGDMMTIESVTAIDEHTLKVKFSRGVAFKEGDEAVSMALRYLTPTGDSDVMVDGRTAIFKGDWKYDGDDKSTILWTLNSKHTDSLTDLLTYAGNFKWNSASQLSFVIMDPDVKHYCPMRSMRINGVTDVTGMHHLVANYATKDLMMTQMTVDVAYELPTVTVEPQTVVEYYSNYTPFIIIASIIGLAVAAITVVVVVSKKKSR